MDSGACAMGSPPPEFEDVDWDDPDAVIAFCEANRHWLDRYAEAIDQEDIRRLLRAKLRYWGALAERGHVAGALTEACHAEELADRLTGEPRAV